MSSSKSWQALQDVKSCMAVVDMSLKNKLISNGIIQKFNNLVLNFKTAFKHSPNAFKS